MFLIHTDGGARGNGKGVSAWAFQVYDRDEYPLGNKSEGFAAGCGFTNNAMELEAIIQALTWLHKTKLKKAVIYTDSDYCNKGINQWMAGWKRNHWRNSSNKPVKNLDQWRKVDRLLQGVVVEVKWVKGHATGNHFEAVGNRQADALCNMRMDEAEFDNYLDSHLD